MPFVALYKDVYTYMPYCTCMLSNLLPKPFPPRFQLHSHLTTQIVSKIGENKENKSEMIKNRQNCTQVIEPTELEKENLEHLVEANLNLNFTEGWCCIEDGKWIK